MSTTTSSSTERNINRASQGLAVSVIVPVRNGGSRLPKLVEALAAQTLPRERFEVLIADDGSTDGAAQRLETDNVWLRVLPGPPQNSYVARNRAAAAAKAPVLAFCDGDCEPEPDWLEQGLRALERAELVGGLILPSLPARPTVWTLLDVDLHVDQERAIRSGRGLGGNILVREDVFRRLGGFDESLVRTGDAEFFGRAASAGVRIALASGAVVRHPTHDRAAPFLRKIWTIWISHGTRDRVAGIRPKTITTGAIPIFGMARSRRRGGQPLRLDRSRLGDAASRIRLWQELKALLILYLLLPYLSRAARITGWWKASRVTAR